MVCKRKRKNMTIYIHNNKIYTYTHTYIYIYIFWIINQKTDLHVLHVISNRSCVSPKILWLKKERKKWVVFFFCPSAQSVWCFHLVKAVVCSLWEQGQNDQQRCQGSVIFGPGLWHTVEHVLCTFSEISLRDVLIR